MYPTVKLIFILNTFRFNTKLNWTKQVVQFWAVLYASFFTTPTNVSPERYGNPKYLPSDVAGPSQSKLLSIYLGLVQQTSDIQRLDSNPWKMQGLFSTPSYCKWSNAFKVKLIFMICIKIRLKALKASLKSGGFSSNCSNKSRMRILSPTKYPPHSVLLNMYYAFNDMYWVLFYTQFFHWKRIIYSKNRKNKYNIQMKEIIQDGLYRWMIST